jgi:hypothetical protein
LSFELGIFSDNQQIESFPEMLAWDWQIPSISGGFVNPPGAAGGVFSIY